MSSAERATVDGCRLELAGALCGQTAVLPSRPYDPNDPFWQGAEAEGVHLLLIDVAQRTGGANVWPPDSIAQARQTRVRLRVVSSPGLAHDVDTPENYRQFSMRNK